MTRPIYIFAGGGTGGHLYPGLAVAEEVVRAQPEAQVVFACSDQEIDRHILKPQPYAFVPQPVRPLPRRPGAVWGFLRTYAPSALQARQMVADLRPVAVLGLGGFAAGPVLCRAAKRGIRTGLLNPDAVPGKANRLLARRVDAIFTQYTLTAERFAARVRPKVRVVGCPVRAAFATAARDQAVAHFGLRSDRRTLFVNGGSLGAASVNEAVAYLAGDLAALSDTWQIVHVTGRSKLSAPPGAFAGLHVCRLEYCERMDLAYAVADLALSRAGASTTAELAATGTPAVLMPYPHHADQHQRLNASALADIGAAAVCDDAQDPVRNAEALRRVLLPILGQAKELERMRAAARRSHGPDAARRVARWLAGQ